MAMNGDMFHPAASSRMQQMPHYGSFQHHNQLNPQVPRFQPSNMELQRYHYEAATLTPGINGQHFPSASYDMAPADHLAYKTQEQITEIRDAVGRDMRVLQHEINQLRTQISSTQVATLGDGPGVLEIYIAPPDAMVQRFGPLVTADLYVEQAKAFEDKAAYMKKTANELYVSVSAGQDGATKLLEASRSDDEPVAPDTPTHTPARRNKRGEQSQTIELEAPAENGAANGEAGQPTTKEHKTVTPSKENNPLPTPPVGWQPLAVRQLKAPPIPTNPSSQTFTWEFLARTFHGTQWSPGFYFVPTSHSQNLLPSNSYWILEAAYEPFLPSSPGQHGAKLTAFFNSTFTPTTTSTSAPDENNYMDVPVFICPKNSNEYTYFGHYSQSRFSDKLDHERVMETVPEHVRRYWAQQLAAKEERPEWVTGELMRHFWPRPEFHGPVPSDDSGVGTPETAGSGGEGGGVEKRVVRALEAYAEELREWEKEARLKVGLLTPEAMMRAFGQADADEAPGLRLWWEYLECVRYDGEFVEMLGKLKGVGAKAAQKAVGGGFSGKAGVQNGTKTTAATAGSANGSSNATVVPAAATAKQAESAKADKKGDLELAKQMSQEFKKGGKTTGGRGKKEAYVLPHLRGKQ